MNRLRLISALSFILFSHLAFGQSYITAGGIRVDNGVHLTLQQYLFDDWTAEGILHTAIGSKDLGITVLGEKHHKILFRGTNIYTGAGFHYYGSTETSRADQTVHHNVTGLSFIGGIEMSVGRLNFALDWKPELHLSGADGHPFGWNGASVSVRYIFAKRERKKIKDWKVWDTFRKKD
jgi:hypothetical protein